VIKFAQDLFTGSDNETFDVARILWAICVISLIAYTGFDLYQGRKFDIAAFAGGCAALLFGGGAGVWIKRETEPPFSDAVRKNRQSDVSDNQNVEGVVK
jgi:hypothetical protein